MTVGVNVIEWRDDLHPSEWDSALADLGGHPLQSALWGNARREVDGIKDHRWAALYRGVPVWMVRLEERRVPGLGCVAWAPKGPTGKLPGEANFPLGLLRDRLRRHGTTLIIANPWEEAAEAPGNGLARPKTIWIDTSVGRSRLWENLDKQWRYGVGRAERLGVVIEKTPSPSDIESFFSLCDGISRTKGFRLIGSAKLMKHLLASKGSGPVEARLFIARFESRLAAGAFVIRCGKSMHYFWGGTDRALSKQRVGEAVQWAAMEWALENQCRRYDLEGIDPRDNRGVYDFKRKMGGREITLVGKRHFPLDLRGQLLGWLDKRFN